VPGLTNGDAERLLRFVAEVEDSGADQLFTPELLVQLGCLIEADWMGYSELDEVRHRELLWVVPGEDDVEDDGADYSDLYALVADEHPICTRLYTGEHQALKLSDFMSLRELRRSRIYALWFGPFGVERLLYLAIPSPMWHRKTLRFERGKGRDFTERDRAVLNHLQPHLAHLWQAARTRRLLRASLAQLDGVDEQDARGVVLLGAAGDIEFASPPAVRLLREFFAPIPGGRMPPELVDWLERGGEQALTRGRGDRVLRVERQSDGLLLEERRVEARLTARERDVLSWVARGKTNAEIAELLWLAPSTVRKHLENVYAKLGVSTRTAAVARFLGLIDAAAS
jgi:DNA-binding CsgD family transcriptional regulator